MWTSRETETSADPAPQSASEAFPDALFCLTDTLTGLANRKALVIALGTEIEVLARSGLAFSLIALSIAGENRDETPLRVAAEVLAGKTRREELAAHLDGQDFALLLREGRSAASATALRLRRDLGEALMEAEAPAAIAMAVVTVTQASADPAAVLREASQRLAEASGHGIVVATLP